MPLVLFAKTSITIAQPPVAKPNELQKPQELLMSHYNFAVWEAFQRE